MKNIKAMKTWDEIYVGCNLRKIKTMKTWDEKKTKTKTKCGMRFKFRKILR